MGTGEKCRGDLCQEICPPDFSLWSPLGKAVHCAHVHFGRWKRSVAQRKQRRRKESDRESERGRQSPSPAPLLAWAVENPTHSSALAWEIHGPRSPAGYSA